MWRAVCLVLLAAACLGLSGCVTGRLYTHIVTPLDLNLEGAPAKGERARTSSKRFQYYVRIEWGSEALGEVARDNGMQRIYYADLETRSLLGIWTQRYVIVYGE